MDEQDVKEYLVETSPDFRELLEQHQEYEKELEQFNGLPYLSSADQLKETELKKKKLALKDRMQLMINEHRGHSLST